MKYTEFLTYVYENVENEEVKAIAKARLEREAKEQATRKAYADKKAAEARAEKAALAEEIFAALTDEPQTATDLIEAAGKTGTITPQGVAALVKNYGEGKVAKTEIKIAGVKGKKVGYVKA